MYLIQHGWGKGQRISGAIDDGDCHGAILGPCDESPENLATLAQEIHDRGLEVVIDPQFYVFALPQPNLKRLDEYPYARPGLRPTDFSARGVSAMVDGCLSYQATLPVSSIVSPTVLQTSFTDRWAQIALTLAVESVEWHRASRDERPLLCSVLIGEENLSDSESVNEYLDSLTELECSGFYLVVARSSPTYDLFLPAERLTNLLNMIHSLSELNEYDVTVGYADYLGLLYLAAGARAYGSGWYQTLRRFHADRWLGGPGGRQPRPRYSSFRLLSNLFLETELRTIAERGRLDEVLTDSARDADLREASPRVDEATWTLEESHRQHMHVCRLIDGAVDGPLVDRLRSAERLIETARTLYTDLSDTAGIIFAPETGPRHLGAWLAAMSEFAAGIGVSL